MGQSALFHGPIVTESFRQLRQILGENGTDATPTHEKPGGNKYSSESLAVDGRWSDQESGTSTSFSPSVAIIGMRGAK